MVRSASASERPLPPLHGHCWYCPPARRPVSLHHRLHIPRPLRRPDNDIDYLQTRIVVLLYPGRHLNPGSSVMTDSPSIFTPKDTLGRGALRPTISSQRAVRTSSPFRRKSTPEVPGAAIAETGNTNTKATGSPGPSPGSLDTAGSPSIWNSFAERSRPHSREHKGRSVSLDSNTGSVSPLSELAPPLLPLPPPPPPPRTPTTSEPRHKRKLTNSNPYPNPGPTSEPSSKRQRLRPRIKHTLDSSSYFPSDYSALVQPTSPLFFSNSPRPRPTLPPRFSSSEAAARMLSKARTEEAHVKTVSLARGTVTTPSAGYALPVGSPRNRRSLERGSVGRSSSPDAGANSARDGMPGMTHALNSVGIVELLEQDERPTFIVDLGESTNYGPGPLQLVFCNPSLRSYDGMQALVSGTSVAESPGPKTFLQFKSWLLSAAVAGESLNVCLPPFNYAGMTWSCSTVRKRFRIISGAFITPPATSTAAMRVSIPPVETLPDAPPPAQSTEAIDYFGAVPDTKTSNSDGSSSTVTEIVPTIESRSTEGEGRGTLLHVPPELDLSGAVDLLPSPTTYVQLPPNSGAGDNLDANSILSSPTSKEGQSANDGTLNSQIPIVASDAASFDWTRLPVTDNMPSHIRFARSIDWGSTSLGPIESWVSSHFVF